MDENNPGKSISYEEKLSLKSWSLPKTILETYLARGISHMFPWQVECLTQEGVLSGKSLVYSAPTSAGKTMVAEIITIQTVLERKKKVIFILPFVSVVREKMLYFQNVLGTSGVRVEGFMGSHAPPGGLRAVHIAVCTIEKANSLINRLLEEQGLDAVGCVVVDELHLLGDPHRGYLLELLLTKLKYMCCKDKTLKIQVVGMSATLPNVDELATWLGAALYTTEFRPIPLTEYLKVNSSVYDVSTMDLKCNIEPISKFKSDPGDVIHLCLESLLAGHSVLVFCPTRGWCETSAQQIAAEFRRIGYEKTEMGLSVREQLNGAAISDVIELLKRCPAGLDPSLGRSVAFGVAFHHAGLTMDERDIVEGAFRSGVLRVLVATSTLSSGVNLPARRVLIRCPPRHMSSDVRSYRQMVGRAGRMGKDAAGESFLICSGSERCVGEQLVRAQLPPVESSLGLSDLSASLKRAVLEVIASGVVNTSEDVKLYTSCTFLASSTNDDSDDSLADPLAACIEYLQANEFIRVSGGTLGPTPLAEACLSASLPPDQGLKLLKELHRARQCFVLETELHVIYQVTPYSVSDQWGELDWLRVLSLWEDLPFSMKRVGELVGVEERFLVGAVRGTVNMKNSAQKLSIHRRFYTALALQDLVNEVPLPQVAVKFNCSKGVLQSLQQSASTFAGMVTQFTRRLGWSNVELLVSQFGARLQFGAQRELLDLLRLDCLTAVQARALYNSGMQVLADLATASVSKVERALARATPFHSEQDGENQKEGSDKHCIWLVGRCAVSGTQAAEILVNEARQFLERELGLQSANWGDLNNSLASSVADKSLTQSLASPPVPIATIIKEKRGVTDKVINSMENQEKSEEKEPYITVSKLSKASPVNDNEKGTKGCHYNITNGESECVTTKYNCVDDCDSKTNMVTKSNTGTPTINVHKKRGSLDLFDSPERMSPYNHHEVPARSEEENLQVSENREVMQMESQRNNSVPSPFKRPNIYPDNETRAKIMTLIPDDDLFSDSPKKTDLKNSLLEMFDANSGGENLIEMSLLVSQNDTGECAEIQNISLWENITEGDSMLLGMSSLITLTEDRKRKSSVDYIRDSKRSKVNSPETIKQGCGTPDANELQVSNHLSKNSNLKTSTPTISQYFEGSIDFDSPFSVHDRNYHTRNNDENHKGDLFMDSNENVENDVSNYAILCNEENVSFELKVSADLDGEESLNDYELNIDSKVFEEMDSQSHNELGKKDSPSSIVYANTSTDNKTRSDSTLNCHVNTSIKFSEGVKERMNTSENNIEEQHVVKTNTFITSNSKNEINKCLFQDSLVIDSKLNALLEVKENSLETSNRKFNSSSQFLDNFSLNSQLCNLLDVKNIKNNQISLKTSVENHYKTFEKKNFNIDSETRDKADKSVIETHCRKRDWTESMEVKEIQNLDFDDEDTILGTPVSHQRSTFCKKLVKNNTTRENVNDRPIDSSRVLLKEPPFQPVKNGSGKNINSESETISKSDVISKKTAEKLPQSDLTGYGKENNKPTNVQTAVNKLSETENSESGSTTKCVLNHDFEESLCQKPEEAENKILRCSEEKSLKNKTLRERENVKSSTSTINKRRSKVEEVPVKDEVSRREFRSELIRCKCVVLLLSNGTAEGTGGVGRIGTRFISKTAEPSYPCCHNGEAVTSAVIYTGNSRVFLVMLNQENCVANLALLTEMVRRKDLVICSWEVKRTVRQLRQCCQLQCDSQLSDPTVAEWMLKPHQNTLSLKQMAQLYGVTIPQCSNKTVSTALLVWELCNILKAKLRQGGLYKAYKEVEMPIQLMLAEMEVEGVGWDREYTELLWTAVEDKMTDLQNTMYTLADRKFNMRSHTDLVKVKKILKESSEQKLEEFSKVLRNWRVLNSLKTRNMSALLMLETDRIQGCWDTHTLTGRISMHEPNLQHFPRDISIDNQVFSLRSAIVASPGNTLVSADFSQLELRLLAHFSQDTALLETFVRPGDVFSAIAAKWHNIPEDQVGAELRHHTKQLCYGLVYGMGLATLAEEMGVEEGKAAEMAASFHQSYPGLQAYVGRCIAACRSSAPCHVTTLLGRRRYLPDINSRNMATRAQAERQAVNTTIQGSAADIAKTAMLRVRAASSHRSMTARLIIHLHDELIYEVAQQDEDEFLKILRKEMEGAVSLSIPLPVKIKKGSSWGLLELVE